MQFRPAVVFRASTVGFICVCLLTLMFSCASKQTEIQAPQQELKRVELPEEDYDIFPEDTGGLPDVFVPEGV